MSIDPSHELIEEIEARIASTDPGLAPASSPGGSRTSADLDAEFLELVRDLATAQAHYRTAIRTVGANEGAGVLCAECSQERPCDVTASLRGKYGLA